MNIIDLLPAVKYIVTKGSDDGTFSKGDHIVRDPADGVIVCQEASGWIDKEYIEDSIKGMEVKIDIEWAKKRADELRDEVLHLDKVYGVLVI